MSKPVSKTTVAILQILVAGTLWGLVGPLIKLMELNGSTAEVTSFIRMGFAFLIMGAITVAKFGVRSFKVDRRTLVACAALGVVSNGIYNVIYTMAIANAGITVSAVLLNTAPLFTTVASMIVFREGISLIKALALVVNIVGCSLAATGGNFSFEAVSLLGIVCAVGSGLTYGMAAIITRLAGSSTNTYVMSTYSFLFAFVFVALFFQPWNSPEAYSPAVMGYGFLLALVPTSLAYLLYYKGVLKMTETSKVPIFASTEMVATAVISVAFFGESLSPAALLGIALVIVSIALMSVKAKAKR